MNYTKGPWKWDYNTESLPALEEVLMDAEGNKVLSIDGDGVEGFYLNVSEENKLLMAAAPDLLKILKQIESNVRRCPICKCLKENGHDYNCELWQVLSKIEGRD